MPIPQELLDSIRANRATELPLQDAGMTVADMELLAEALRDNTSVQEIHLHLNPIGDAGVVLLAGALHNKPNLRHLNLHHTELGDEGVKALAKSFEGTTSPDTLWLHGNQITSAGMQVLAETLPTIPSLVYCTISGNPSGRTALHEVNYRMLLQHPKNIRDFGAESHQGMKDRCAQNQQEMADILLNHLSPLFNNMGTERTEKSVSPRALCMASARWHIIDNYAKSVCPGLRQMIAELVWHSPLEGRDFVGINHLFEKDAEGLTPLDYPATWDLTEFLWMLDKQDLMSLNKDGEPYLYAAIYSEKLGNALHAMNRRHEVLGRDDLLAEDGSPTPLFALIIKEGQVPALFTHANWKDQPVGDMKAVYELLPSIEQERVNYRTLLMKLQRDQLLASPQQGRG